MTDYLSLYKSRITVLLLFLCSHGLVSGQSKELWEKYILAPHSTSNRVVKHSGVNWIIELNKNMKASDLIADDLQILRQFDKHTYLVKPKHDLSNINYISNTWETNNLWKLAAINQSTLEQDDGLNSFLVRIDLETSKDKTWLKELEPLSKSRGIYSYYGKLSYVIDTLISDPSVLSVTQESQNPRTESLVKDMNINTNSVNKVHHVYPNYDGTHQVISIQENPYDVLDIDLLGRDIPNNVSADRSSDTHATDMATIIAGAGNSFINGRGVLNAAHVTSSDFLDVLPDEPMYYESQDVTVQNHSYGTTIEAFYGAQAQAFDASAFENPYLIHVFSSGNDGASTSLDGPYNGVVGWSNITGNYKMSKNTLVVGAVDFERNEVPFSSRGPAYDGRLKPELVAYGQDGSSNSAALISGISGMLQQAYSEKTQSLLPSALLKAYLINNAEDAGQPGLDHVTGYGCVDAYKTVKSLLSEQHFTDTLSFEEKMSFTLNVPAHVENLKITLCWTDPPSAVGNIQALVNDLDMQLITPEDEEILPWVLNTEADSLLLLQKATRNVDHINNIEQVSLEFPAEGTYHLEVSGFDVPQGPQPFFLTYSWDEVGGFEWNYPTGSDPVPYDGGSNSYLYWKSTFGDERGKIEYSLDGSSWVVLRDGVDLSQGFWKWENIPAIYSNATLRMTIDNETFDSDSFVISRPLTLGLGFDCSDSIMLQWNHVPEALDYNIAHMGEMYLENYATTSDTFLIIDKSELISPFVSVAANLMGGGTTTSSYTTDHNLLGGTCFVSFFYQQELSDKGINLVLELGTTLGVEQVRMDRKVDGQYVLVELIESVNTTSISVLDDQPNEGFNEHVATVTLTNGQKIIANAGSAYYFSETQLLVFPNPIDHSENLNIFRAESSSIPVFKLYNGRGQKVLHINTPNTKESIYIGNLVSGIYSYVLEVDNKKTIGRLIVN